MATSTAAHACAGAPAASHLHMLSGQLCFAQKELHLLAMRMLSVLMSRSKSGPGVAIPTVTAKHLVDEERREWQA